MTVFGWDASDFDRARGPMNLALARQVGIEFFTNKATESTNVRHLYFGEAMRRARDAGIEILGAYHVVRSPRNAAAEVDFFLSYVDREFPEWSRWPHFFIQVDLEKWPYDAVAADEGENFADIAEVQARKRAIIYASKGQYGNDLAGTSHPLWNANYALNYTAGNFQDLYRRAGGDGGAGWSRYSGEDPAIWQYTSSANIGTQPTCDANAYRGSLEQLKALTRGLGGDMAGEADSAYAVDSASARVSPNSWMVRAVARPLETLTLAAVDQRARDAADAQRDNALAVSLDALAAMVEGAGGSVDTAVIKAAFGERAAATEALIREQFAAERAEDERRHNQQMIALDDDWRREVASMQAALDAVRAQHPEQPPAIFQG